MAPGEANNDDGKKACRGKGRLVDIWPDVQVPLLPNSHDAQDRWSMIAAVTRRWLLYLVRVELRAQRVDR